MSLLFLDRTGFNRDTSNWDVSSVTDMIVMFRRASSFNQNLEKWNIKAHVKIYGTYRYPHKLLFLGSGVKTLPSWAK